MEQKLITWLVVLIISAIGRILAPSWTPIWVGFIIGSGVTLIVYGMVRGNNETK